MKTTSVPSTETEVRHALAAGLHTRKEEIEGVARAQVDAILGTKQVSDPQYTEGLRVAIGIALDFGLTLIERGGRNVPPIPAALLLQARLAARNGLGLETVLRRYVAGYTLFNDFLLQEAASSQISGEVLTPILRTQRVVFNKLLEDVSEEYAQETTSQLGSDEERLAERVQSLLDGESVDTSEIPYDFEGHHLGAVSTGAEAPKAIRALARALDRRSLTAPRSDGAVYAWLGGRKAQSWADIEETVYSNWPSEIPLALGEPTAGRSGWRLTHQQARAAFPIALRMGKRPLRYREVALEASTSQDDLLVASLERLYLKPLSQRHVDGEKIRRTLRAFFDVNRSPTAAAKKLEVRRHTVTYRIATYEDLIGQSLDECAKAVWVALRLEELGYMSEPQ